jgi:hypothetical protein
MRLRNIVSYSIYGFFIKVSHCLATRRIAVGTKAGLIAMYEMRASKVQNIPAHQVHRNYPYLTTEALGVCTAIIILS